MQTFLPLPDFRDSLSTLDRQRLGKQRVEAYQILRSILGETKGWGNHPITRMWAPYPYALCEYGIIACEEWMYRGYKDSMLDSFLYYRTTLARREMPTWLGNHELHRSHRANLLRKAPDWYGQFGWVEDTSLPYWYPS